MDYYNHQNIKQSFKPLISVALALMFGGGGSLYANDISSGESITNGIVDKGSEKYGIYFDNQTSGAIQSTLTGDITFSAIQATSGNAYGMYFGQGDLHIAGKHTISFASISGNVLEQVSPSDYVFYNRDAKVVFDGSIVNGSSGGSDYAIYDIRGGNYVFGGTTTFNGGGIELSSDSWSEKKSQVNVAGTLIVSRGTISGAGTSWRLTQPNASIVLRNGGIFGGGIFDFEAEDTSIALEKILYDTAIGACCNDSAFLLRRQTSKIIVENAWLGILGDKGMNGPPSSAGIVFSSGSHQEGGIVHFKHLAKGDYGSPTLIMANENGFLFHNVRLYYGDYEGFDTAGNRAGVYANLKGTGSNANNGEASTLVYDTYLWLTTREQEVDYRYNSISYFMVKPNVGNLYGLYFEGNGGGDKIEIVGYGRSREIIFSDFGTTTQENTIGISLKNIDLVLSHNSDSSKKI